MLEEIERYSPAELLLKRDDRCVPVTPNLFFEILKESGQSMRSIPWEITIPRRGWIVLVPRIPDRRRRRRAA